VKAGPVSCDATEDRRRTFVSREEVLAAFGATPALDADRFRADLESGLDQDLPDRAW
jgi:hypothetical protein